MSVAPESSLQRNKERSNWSLIGLPFLDFRSDLTTTSAGVSVFLTNRDSSPRSKISVCTLGCPELGWRDIIPSHPKGVLVQADSIGGGLLLIVFSLDVGHQVRLCLSQPPLFGDEADLDLGRLVSYDQVWIYTDEGVPVRRVSDVEVPYGGMIKAFGCGKDQSEFSIESESTNFLPAGRGQRTD